MSEISDAGAITEVTVVYKLSDYFLAMARRWRAWLIAFIALSVFVILLPLLFALLDGCTWRCAWASMDWHFSGMLFLFILAWLFVAPLLSFLVAKKRGDLVPVTFTLTDAGVQIVNASAQSLLYWTAITRLDRTPRGLLFFMRSRPMGVPRRSFDSSEQFDSFVAAAKELWKQHHRL